MLRLEPYLKNAKHVVWDWNGTLLSDVHHTLSTVNHFLKENNLEQMDVERYRHMFGFPIRSYYERLGFDFTKISFEKICHDFTDLYMSKVFSCELFPGAKDLLKQVKASGKTQSILSASDQESLNKMVDFYQIRPFFDHTYGIADRLAASKVQRGEELITHSGIDPKDTVLFGDTDHDLEVGEALGIPVVLLAHGHQSALRLQKIHHTVVELPER